MNFVSIESTTATHPSAVFARMEKYDSSNAMRRRNKWKINETNVVSSFQLTVVRRALF